jgi:TPR repeat protein
MRSASMWRDVPLGLEGTLLPCSRTSMTVSRQKATLACQAAARTLAFRWYLRGAKQGVLRAQFNVGLCYRDGDGVKASGQKAREWLRKAARRGHAQARDVLTAMLQSARPIRDHR